MAQPSSASQKFHCTRTCCRKTVHFLLTFIVRLLYLEEVWLETPDPCKKKKRKKGKKKNRRK
jgi:hypothetical protein